MSRLDIDQTEGRGQDIQQAIDDDPRQIFMVDLDVDNSVDYINETKYKKTLINGTIYKKFRNSLRFSVAGAKSVSRDDYYLLTSDDVNPNSYIECEDVQFDVVNVENIRGGYKRVELLSKENGGEIRGFT